MECAPNGVVTDCAQRGERFCAFVRRVRAYQSSIEIIHWLGTTCQVKNDRDLHFGPLAAAAGARACAWGGVPVCVDTPRRREGVTLSFSKTKRDKTCIIHSFFLSGLLLSRDDDRHVDCVLWSTHTYIHTLVLRTHTHTPLQGKSQTQHATPPHTHIYTRCEQSGA